MRYVVYALVALTTADVSGSIVQGTWGQGALRVGDTVLYIST